MAEQEQGKPAGQPTPVEVDDDGFTPISMEPQKAEEAEEYLEPISLVEVDEAHTTAVKAFGSAAADKSRQATKFQRPLNVTGTGATRCRVFSSRIAHNPLEYMENQINEWVDNDQIEIKHVGHVVGVMEGKIAELNLIVMVWY